MQVIAEQQSTPVLGTINEIEAQELQAEGEASQGVMRRLGALSVGSEDSKPQEGVALIVEPRGGRQHAVGYVRVSRNDPGTVISPKLYNKYGLAQPDVALHSYNEHIAQTQPLRLADKEVQNIAVTFNEIERHCADADLDARDVDDLLQRNLEGYPVVPVQGASGRPLAGYMTAGAMHDRQSASLILKESAEGLLTASDGREVMRILAIGEDASLHARVPYEIIDEALEASLKILNPDKPSDQRLFAALTAYRAGAAASAYPKIARQYLDQVVQVVS